MKSLAGFLKNRRLSHRFSQEPIIVHAPVPNTSVTVAFSVHTWFEYHHRARDSYTGEPDMVEWLATTLKPGDVLWDIGANVGAYSLLAAKLCQEARVVAFEPFIPNFAHLWQNIVLNEVTSQVFPVCAGLTDKTAPTALAVSDPQAGSSHHQVGQPGGKLQQAVVAGRGDDLRALLGLAAPTLLKLDIDGIEVAAIEGLHETLRLPALREVMIEIEQGKSEAPVQALCEAAGFKRVPATLLHANGGVFNARFVKG